MSQPQTSPYDVAIVGLGPTGAVLANLLGRAGVRVLVLEREAAIHPLPRAVHFDGEAMRIFQAAGLSREVAAVARPSSKGMHFVNAEGRTMLIRRGYEGPGPQGWASNWYVHQPFLEAVLRRGLERWPSVDVRLGREVTAIEDAASAARIRAAEPPGGEARTFFEARLVVGCDGARSLVRRLIGSSVEDLGLRQPWLVVDVLTDPASARAASLPEHTVQHCDPARPATAVYVGGNRRRWEIMLMPGDVPERMTEPEQYWPLLARWIGPQDGRVERAAVYTFHSMIARGWRNGRLLLAGDACHLTPPFLGQGMCAGLRDAMNLAWKLVLIVKRGAPEALLDTYESERRPHVEAFIRLAVELGGIIQATDPAATAERDRRLAGEPRMFDFPQPHLGPGVHEGRGAAGMVQPQPRLADGRLLDEVAGGRPVLLLRRKLLDAASPAAREQLAAVDVVPVMAENEPEIAAQLFALDAQALLLRPDGYAFGAAATPAELDHLSARLAGLLAPRR